MNEGPRWPTKHMGSQYCGYLTTVAGVDIHVNEEWVCLVWGPTDDDWNGRRFADWLSYQFRGGFADTMPEAKHAELLAFIIPFCQLHQ